MESASFLQDMAVVLLAAGSAALVFHRLRQPRALGYILAGLLLGPHAPPFSLIADETTIRTLADLGVIFLMFSVGLEFNLRRLRKVGATATVTAFLDVSCMVCLGFALGRAMGWSTVESLFLGGILCDSSTTILAKTLQEMGRTRERFAGVAIGISVVEDALAVGMIAVLTGVAVTGTVQAGMVAGRLLDLTVFLTVLAVVGLLTLPRLLDYLHRFGSDELLVVPLLGLCFGVTRVAAHMELSMALGAVLVGAIASESRAIHRIGPLIDPLRYTFSAVFFVAVGLLLDPAMLLQHWAPLLAATAVVMGGKFVTNAVGTLLTGHDMPTAVRVGAGMAQTGEFAFIIAALGITLGATGSAVYQVGVGAAVLSTLLSPYLIRGADRLAAAMDRSPGCRRCTHGFELYHEWMARIGRRQDSVVRRAVRRSVAIMVVNVVLISAAMFVAGYLARRPLGFLAPVAAHPGVLPVVLWCAAMLVCLPMYVATLRKLQALAMILAEVALPITIEAAWARSMRGFVTNAILAAGTAGMVLLTFILSSALLPSTGVFVLLMAGTAAVAAWRWPRLVRVHAQAQRAVESMLDADAGAAGARHPSAADSLDLNMEAGTIEPGACVVGRDLRSIQLRSRTGATVVAIERAGERIVNPGPQAELHAGDRVYLLGSPKEIDAVRTLLRARGN